MKQLATGRPHLVMSWGYNVYILGIKLGYHPDIMGFNHQQKGFNGILMGFNRDTMGYMGDIFWENHGKSMII